MFNRICPKCGSSIAADESVTVPSMGITAAALPVTIPEEDDEDDDPDGTPVYEEGQP